VVVGCSSNILLTLDVGVFTFDIVLEEFLSTGPPTPTYFVPIDLEPSPDPFPGDPFIIPIGTYPNLVEWFKVNII